MMDPISIVGVTIAFLVQFGAIIWGASRVHRTTQTNTEAVERIMDRIETLEDRQRLFERDTHARLSVVEKVALQYLQYSEDQKGVDNHLE